jgi:hypothetical protein
MSDFAKVTVAAYYADNATYNPVLASLKITDFTSTPDEFRRDKVDAEVAGTTITTSYLTSIESLIVKNNDSSNSVTLACQNAAAAAVSQVIGPGKIAMLPDVKASANVTLTAAGATCRCDVWLTGT